MTISLKSTVNRKAIASATTRTGTDPHPRPPAKRAAQELAKRIVDPDALRRQPSSQASPNSVSSIEVKRGLEVNMRTLERARKIFDNLLYSD